MDSQKLDATDAAETKEGRERFDRVMRQLRAVQALKPATPGMDPEAWKVLDSLLAATRRVDEMTQVVLTSETPDK